MRYLAAILLLVTGCAPLKHTPRNYLPAIAVAVGIAESSNPQPTPEPLPTPTPSGKCENCGGTGKIGDGTVFVDCPVCGGDGITAVIIPLTLTTLPHGAGTGEGWPPKALPEVVEPSPEVPTKPAVKSAVLNKQPATPPRVAAPISKPTATPLNGRYEWRTRRVCKGGYCVTERYRVFVPTSSYPTRGNLWVVHGSDVRSHLVREHGFNASYVATLSDLEARSLHSDAHEHRVKWEYVKR